MNQILLGVFLGVLGLGVIAFLLAALLSVRKLTTEISSLRVDMHDSVNVLRDVLMVARPLKEVIEDSIEEFADRMADSTKELRGVARIGSALEGHTEQCKELAVVGKDFIKHSHALTALLGSVYGILVRPGMQPPPEHVDIPKPAAEIVEPTAVPKPVDTPEPPPQEAGEDFSSFHAFSEKDAAVREAEAEAKRSGAPIAEDPEHPVPAEQMKSGGNV